MPVIHGGFAFGLYEGAVRNKVVEQVLQPDEVGGFLGRDIELPAHIETFVESVGVVDGLVYEDVGGAEAVMEVAEVGLAGWLAGHGGISLFKPGMNPMARICAWQSE